VWLVPQVDGTAVAYLVLTWVHSMEHGGLAAIIDDLFVRPGARRQGAARALLDRAWAECRARGCCAVQVEVAPDHVAAQALYAGYGLHPRDDGRLTLTPRLA
jgi:ribosomal protein S18 acetylase RimI-like enzyme